MRGIRMMNKKENVLDAWIEIEHLSEGNIKKNSQQLRNLGRITAGTEDVEKYFLNFLAEQKKKRNINGNNFKKSGIAIYFDVFNFQEIIDILREKYNLKETNEEIEKSDKFTLALYFDYELNLNVKKIFMTKCGHIRYQEQGKAVQSTHEQMEGFFKSHLPRQMEDHGFYETISEIVQNYDIPLDSCYYTFVPNLDNCDVNLHSPFIQDLKQAKKVSTTNLTRYFEGFSGVRKNLDSNKQSALFNPRLFEKILEPKNFPLGRFPSNTDFALSFMQQVAVNLALNDNNEIRSVNGPPGTGKTTLLKDIFADLVVQQAWQICNLPNKTIKGTLNYWDKAKLGVLPENIVNKNIVVASTNNGAVQNIVNELPLIKDVDLEFRDLDYFKVIANLSGGELEKGEGLQEEQVWGTFSLEGGKAENIARIFSTIENILREFDHPETYQSKPEIYREFEEKYQNLDKKREKVQNFYEKISLLKKLEQQYNEEQKSFENQKAAKQNELSEHKEKSEIAEKEAEQKQVIFNEELRNIENSIKNCEERGVQKQREFEIVKMKQPSLLWLQKLINRKKINLYIEHLTEINRELSTIQHEKDQLINRKAEIEGEIHGENLRIKDDKVVLTQLTEAYNRWFEKQGNYLNQMCQKIEILQDLREESDIDEIDFTSSYEELQNLSPWFDKEFRIAQSNLFIKALDVRKQFLYENKGHLKKAKSIWEHKENYLSKENGSQIISEAWQWLNLAIPVVSTTFASFSRMFNGMQENSIGNLFIDEAGQALPQASVGAIFRCKKVMVVGDPSQIRPVLTLDSTVLNMIGRHYEVNEKFISVDSSVQTLVDEASQYGFYKDEEEWIGIPLWVHRRSKDPMFTIANEISYRGLMVHGEKEESKRKGSAKWIDSQGRASDKFVIEHGEVLKNEILEKIKENPNLKDEIYVISPFRNVAYKLAQVLDGIGFTKREKGKPVNVGTVHTFQGKEAKIVYFVLGADNDSKGAASWAVSDPNIMNVAATRAKDEFYIIGDKNLYTSIGSQIVDVTVDIIDKYNR